jgi:hypothetical protein
MCDGLLPPAYLVTVCEPLGVVLEQLWGRMPMYDCPGLFRDPHLRSGMKEAEWRGHFGQVYELPWDEQTWLACVDRLGAVLAAFVRANPGRRWISCLDSPRNRDNTHGAILNAAVADCVLHGPGPFVRQGDRHPRGRRGREVRYQAVAQALTGGQT